MVVSSVSPLRWLIIAAQPACCAIATQSSVSVSVPIWLSLIRMAFADVLADAARQALRVRHEEVVADELHVSPELRRSASTSRSSRPPPGRPRC